MELKLEPILGPASVNVGAFSEHAEAPPAAAPYDGAFPLRKPDELECLLPETLDLDELCNDTPAGALWPPKHRYKLAFVVHSIVRGMYQRHAENDADEARGVPLNQALLRQLLGKGVRDFAKQAVHALEWWGVIVKTSNHLRRHRSRCYRLSNRFSKDRLIVCRFDAPRLVRNLKAHRQKQTQKTIAVHPAFATVARSLAAVSLSAEGHAHADEVIKGLTESNKQAAWRLSLRDLERPAANLGHSTKTGRIYHSVSNCPRELRKFLLIDGETTAEVDMSAAQFYLLLGLYEEPSTERKWFSRVVGSGLFYEHLYYGWPGSENRFGEVSGSLNDLWLGPDGAAQRSAFKEYAVRKLLYERLYPNPKNPKAELWTRFANEFPILAALIAERRRSDGLASGFCCAMQRAEADLVLGRVIPRISSELLGCLPVSIHDGILCQRRFARAVAQVMREEGFSAFGHAPAVKIKPVPPA